MKKDQIGTVTGLAWTAVGGDILFIEALKTKGKGKLMLTGQLGDVMQESAQAAFSYAKARSNELGIPDEMYSKISISIFIFPKVRYRRTAPVPALRWRLLLYRCSHGDRCERMLR